MLSTTHVSLWLSLNCLINPFNSRDNLLVTIKLFLIVVFQFSMQWNVKQTVLISWFLGRNNSSKDLKDYTPRAATALYVCFLIRHKRNLPICFRYLIWLSMICLNFTTFPGKLCSCCKQLFEKINMNKVNKYKRWSNFIRNYKSFIFKLRNIKNINRRDIKSNLTSDSKKCEISFFIKKSWNCVLIISISFTCHVHLFRLL